MNDIASRRCASCHGAGGQGENPLFPKLAGQNAAYLERQMLNFQRGIRKGPVMYHQTPEHPRAADLNDEEVAALSRYLSTLD